jgi:AraC family transcriptional activator FtrA
VTVCTGTPGPVPAEGAPALLVEHGLDALARADTVVVPGRARPGAPSDEVREALTAAAAGGARMISIRTGAFVLAAAGRPDAAPPPAGR